MPSQSQHILLTTRTVSLHSTPEKPLSLSPDILPPLTPDERSRELCAQSTLLRWRAHRACEISQQLRERLRRSTAVRQRG